MQREMQGGRWRFGGTREGGGGMKGSEGKVKVWEEGTGRGGKGA